MLRGIYSAAAAMSVQEGKVEVSANNLANLDTTGFKRELALQGAGRDLLISSKDATGINTLGPMTLGSGLWSIAKDMEQGTLKETGNNTHMAIFGQGFFSILKDGQTLYTREGAFLVDESGLLATQDGGLILGEGGLPIYIGDRDFRVSEDGGIYDTDGNFLAGIAISDFPSPGNLTKVGGSYLAPSPLSGQAFTVNPSIIQGFLEGSNVKAVEEMVNMISAVRSYERAQKAIQIFDDTLGRSVNDVGKI
jgi:flagellar basal-body rod protein FlgF